jgi:hypothetical protein
LEGVGGITRELQRGEAAVAAVDGSPADPFAKQGDREADDTGQGSGTSVPNTSGLRSIGVFSEQLGLVYCSD